MVSGSQCSPGICKPMTIKKEHQEGAVTPHLSDKGPTWADKTWTCICSGESKWSSLTGRMVQARGAWVITWTQSVRRTTIRARSWHLILLAVSYALLIPLSLFYLSYFLPVLKKKKEKKSTPKLWSIHSASSLRSFIWKSSQWHYYDGQFPDPGYQPELYTHPIGQFFTFWQLRILLTIQWKFEPSPSRKNAFTQNIQ